MSASDHSQNREPFLNRATILAAVGAIIIALFGLLGYIPGLGLLGSIREGYIPMAPSTAISFIVLGSILLAINFRSLSGTIIVLFGALAVAVSLFGVLEVVGHLVGRDMNFEDTLVPAAGSLGEIPIARMSASTGALFFLAGFAVFILLLRVRTAGRISCLAHCAGSLGCLVLTVSLVFCLAYILGSPLLYGQGATVPMALTTALAFLMLGAATVAISGKDAIPYSLLSGFNFAVKSMSPRKRFLVLVLIMVGACTMVMVIITVMLYQHDFNEYKEQLQTTAQSQARLIEAIARFDINMANEIRDEYPDYDATTATLSQVIDAHEYYEGFGETGEFTLAQRDGDSIVFILRHRFDALKHPAPVAFDSNLAEPMRRALKGMSGIILGLDYRGETVLAAHEPVAELNLGIVAKIDLAEIRAPFIRAGLLASAVSLFVVFAGAAMFIRIGNPMIERLEAYTRDLEKEVEERKRAEEELRESEAQNRAILEVLPDIMFCLTREGVHLDFYAASDEELFAPADQIIGRRVDELMPFDVTEKYMRYIARTIDDDRMQVFEYRLDFSDADKRYYEARMVPQSDGNVLTLVRDITERKETEEALLESEEQFRRGVMDAPFPIMIHVEDGEVLRINNVWTQLTGYTHDDIPTVVDWTSKAYGQEMDDALEVMQSVFQRNAVASDGEFTIRTKSGRIITWDFSSGPLGQLADGRRLVITMASDITKRKQAEKKINQQQYYLEKGQEIGRIGTWELDLINNKLYWTDENCRIFGVAAGSVLNYEIFMEKVYPDDRQYVDRQWKAALEGKPYDIEHRLIIDGVVKWVREKADVQFDENAVAVNAIGFTQEITERKKVEEKLYKYEQESRAWLENSPVCTKIVDLDFNLQFMSSSGIKELKIDDITEFYGKPYPFSFYPESFRIPTMSNLKKVKETGVIIKQEASVVDIKGNKLWYHSTLVPVNDDQGRIEYIIVLSIETTDRKLAETQREQLIAELEMNNQEMEQLIYTISHDMKTPLVTIGGYLGMLKSDTLVGDTEQARQDIDRIENAADRMCELLDDLLQMSRIGRLNHQMEDVSLADLTKQTIELVAGHLPPQSIQFDISSDLPVIYGDRSRLLELLQNLIENAIKYIGDQPHPRIEIGCRNDNNETIFYVKDNGIGIAPKFHEKVFNIFEQLNPQQSEGTGAGLAIVKRIVETFNGRIWIESDGNCQGATFCFTLPANNSNT